MPYSRLLVVDDEHVVRESMAAWMREDGFNVDAAASGEEAIRMVEQTDYAISFVDLKMPPGIDGIETLHGIRRVRPDALVVIITAHGTVDTAIQAIRAGAQEYLLKPCNLEEISLLVRRVLRMRRLERENALLRKKLSRERRVEDIVGKSVSMQSLFHLIREVAGLRSTVLVEGESGTGKEMVARAIHSAGDRSGRPFVGVSCAALTETLLESELFGHEKGAFTGAVARKRGKFELADGGTLLLDEVDDVSPKLQGDLLRVLQERRFFRVGGSEEVEVDVRVIAATKVDLRERVREGRFRDDLYYRLDVIRLRVPPLRERREDVPLLARHFLERYALELRKDVHDLSEGALERLMAHDWPGNVRELENTIERALVGCRSATLGEDDLAFLEASTRARMPEGVPTDLPLHEVEKRVIEAAMKRAGGNVTEAAHALGIDRSSLYDRLKRYEIPR
jgi:DNA-binding NtrC family response regulator